MPLEDKNIVYEWKITIIAQCTKYTLKFEFKELLQSIRQRLASNYSTIFVILKYVVPDDVSAANNAATEGETSVLKFSSAIPGGQSTLPLGKLSLYERSTLTDFFTYHVADVKAKKHLLFLWGHGCGLGYFPLPEENENDDTSAKFIKNGALKQLASRSAAHRFGAVPFAEALSFYKANFSSDPTTEPKHLKAANLTVPFFQVSDTAQIVQNDFPVISAQQMAGILTETGQKINILIACNCFTQMFETGYAFKEVVELMIAAQTSFPTTGFDYGRLFEAIQLLPSLNEEGIAQNLFGNFPVKYDKAYKRKLKKFHPGFEMFFDKVSASAVTLKNYDTLASIINDLGRWLTENFHKKQKVDDDTEVRYLDLITQARFRCGDMDAKNEHWIIDLTYFLEMLRKALLDNRVNNIRFTGIYTAFSDFKRQNLKAFLKPKDKTMYQDIAPIKVIKGGKREPPAPHFLSIFFPDKSKRVTADFIPDILFNMFYSKNATLGEGLKRINNWVEFVRLYHNVGGN